jgi:ubiquinone/menaquinone biosynthesis C-methylase UbiE
MNLWWRLVRFGFYLLYNPFAFTYDLVSSVVSLGAWRCWQRSALLHLSPPTQGAILEIAHGTGSLQLDLHAGGWRSIGLDLSPNMGRIARAKLWRAGVPARLVRGQAQRLPFPDAAFVGVVSTFPSEFIVMPDTLREIGRVLTADGVLVIVPGARFTGGGAARRGLEWAYHVTGQNIEGTAGVDAQTQRAFAGFGFDVVVHEESCPRSAAVVIVGRKKG